MDIQRIDTFNVIGIAVRTTNENGQSSTDIPALWDTFMSLGLLEKIPNKLDSAIYCLYTDYEKDHTKPYTTLIGCRVAHLGSVPEGMIGKSFPAGNYLKRVAKGNLLQGIVFDEWTKIWQSDIPRAYTTDFEVYGEKAQDPENAEVDIWLAV